MKLSELTLSTARAHAKAEPDDVLDPAYLEAAIQYVLNYTGLTMEQADDKPELTVAALVLFAEMTDNKSLSSENDKVNQVLSSLIGMHQVNLM